MDQPEQGSGCTRVCVILANGEGRHKEDATTKWKAHFNAKTIDQSGRGMMILPVHRVLCIEALPQGEVAFVSRQWPLISGRLGSLARSYQMMGR